MPAVHVDLRISSRWILPMTARRQVLENHALIVHDGRILDVLPEGEAKGRYAAAVTVDRSEHLLLPGLVDAHTRIAPLADRAPGLRVPVGAQLTLAAMLKAGTTCFCGLGYYPEESARTALDQGVRAMIGVPIAEAASPWAMNPAEYLTRALNFRDEYRGHPRIATAFAPRSAIGDATLARIATLADELDAGIVMTLHESSSEVAECIARHGKRPLARLQALGLLTPALAAAHMVHVDATDIAVAQRSGIAITFCTESSLRSGNGVAPMAAWAAAGLRLSVGSGAAVTASGPDLWTEIKLLALLSRAPGAGGAPLSAWDAIAAATRGGAAALGLDAEIGTLETGKWADLCCVDMRGPLLLRDRDGVAYDPVSSLVFDGGRDMVSDVWVAGRHLQGSAPAAQQPST